MSSTWRLAVFVLSRLALLAVAGALLGAIFGSPGWGAGAAVAGGLAWQLAQLYRLDFWLRNRRTAHPPESFGLWSQLGAAIVRIHRRKRYHKARTLAVLRELRESTAALPDAVVVLNNAREIQWSNDPANRLLGLKPSRDRGLRIENLLRQPAVGRYLERPRDDQPLIIQVGDAAPQWLALRLLPFGAGRQLLLARDVTATQQLANLRRDFVANASHELRTPLTVIAGYIEAMEMDQDLPTSLAAPLAEMRRQSDRMKDLLDDLLSLARLDSSDAPIEGATVDVPRLLRELREQALQLPRRPGAVDLVVDSPVGLRGDQSLLHSAFWNLIDNAVKYTPADGKVRLRWWADVDGAHFSVSDNGPGIAPEHLPRLTERFYRADPGRSRETGGTGLGLAIAKHALQRQDGRLEIASQLGSGSEFTCHFPSPRIVTLQ